MPVGTQISSNQKKVLVVGHPKGAGKSTLAAYAPGKKLILQADYGSPTFPPGTKREDFFVKTYPVAQPNITFNKEGFISTDKWQRDRVVGDHLWKDIIALQDAFLTRNGEGIQLVGEADVVPWRPDTIVLDGLPQAVSAIIDWILAINQKPDPEDFTSAKGSPDPRKLWGKRLTKVNTFFGMLVPLPVNIVITTWVKHREKSVLDTTGQAVMVQTDELVPMLGGQLDALGPGKVDAAIYLYSETIGNSTKYMARTKPNANLKWVGVRDAYNLPDVVDLTINPAKLSPNPWERLFGGAQ